MAKHVISKEKSAEIRWIKRWLRKNTPFCRQSAGHLSAARILKKFAVTLKGSSRRRLTTQLLVPLLLVLLVDDSLRCGNKSPAAVVASKNLKSPPAVGIDHRKASKLHAWKASADLDGFGASFHTSTVHGTPGSSRVDVTPWG